MTCGVAEGIPLAAAWRCKIRAFGGETGESAWDQLCLAAVRTDGCYYGLEG